MGFLTGAYLKMQSARMRLTLQNELTRIVSQMNRVTKQIGQVERMMTAQQRNCNMAIQAQMQSAAGAAANHYGINFGKESLEKSFKFACYMVQDEYLFYYHGINVWTKLHDLYEEGLK